MVGFGFEPETRWDTRTFKKKNLTLDRSSHPFIYLQPFHFIPDPSLSFFFSQQAAQPRGDDEPSSACVSLHAISSTLLLLLLRFPFFLFPFLRFEENKQQSRSSPPTPTTSSAHTFLPSPDADGTLSSALCVLIDSVVL